ncbi:hypothetical protein LVD15_07685 [Fulvivirga maritima]|uniref:hypothetical protein n=1 Tax=Fulvivirga maritima TaxID=2904247 RepID=UPI001F47F472|nr:hypothetical protein [Fulvivirga maritima]UII28298.1 hypothetical protein LVD15_07685 [Fulvivirga maritima]
MKRSIITGLLLIGGFYASAQTGIPELKQKGNDLSDLTFKEWKIIAEAKGDLNKDGIEDLAFVIQNTDDKNLQLNDGLGVDTVDLNPRVLGIYFGQSDGSYQKQLQSNEFIILRDSPTMDEPFDGILIDKNGVLQIDFHFWYSAGSWYMSNHQYKFRYQNQRFELIGYESDETHRATMNSTNYSINFSTRKMSIATITYNEDTDEEEESKVWKSFELEKLPSIKSLKKPFEWKFQDIRL